MSNSDSLKTILRGEHEYKPAPRFRGEEVTLKLLAEAKKHSVSVDTMVLVQRSKEVSKK